VEEMSMRVRDVLARKPAGVISIDSSATTATVARLLIDEEIGGVPVVDGKGALVGFVSERDIVRTVDSGTKDIREAPVSAVMHRPPPVCSADDSIQAVMARMTRDRLRHLVVMDGPRITGVISVGDIVKQRLEQVETEAGVLRDYVAAQRARG
jgi:CBS domain-containing protein